MENTGNYSKIEIFNQINAHLLTDEKPSGFLNQLSETPVFAEPPFDMLNKQKNTDQQQEYHPEGSVWNHTLLVLDEAAKRKDKSTDAKVFMWAVLLHDIGKPDTTRRRKGKITSYDHDVVGAELATKFLKEFNQDEDFIKAVSALVRWHMQILFVVRGLPFADIKSMKEQTNIHDVALLGLCDRLGRGQVDAKKEKENVEMFLKKVTNRK